MNNNKNTKQSNNSS